MDAQIKRNHVEMLERIRCEYEAMLAVLSARISCAQDLDDWMTIESQTSDLGKIARRGMLEARRVQEA